MSLNWRRSSHSGAGSSGGGSGDCVEVALGLGEALLRDSKLGEGWPVLHTGRAAFGALLHVVKRTG